MSSAALPASSTHAAPGFWQRARRHPGFVIGGVLSLLLLLAAALSYVWTPYSVYEVDMDAKLLPPGAQHWLGTDAFGRDVVSLLLVGARASILVGVIAVGIGIGFGVPFLGYLSDSMTASHGADALRYSITYGLGFYVLSAALYFLAAARLKRDWHAA